MNQPSPSNEPRDPLIDEVRAVRRALLADFDDDLQKLYRHLKDVEAQYADRVVRPASSRQRAGGD